MKALHPNWSTRQVMKHLSRSWNCMTPAQKARYDAMSKKDRERFEKQRSRHRNCIESGQPCHCKLSEAAEQSEIRQMIKTDPPILCLPPSSNEAQSLVDGPSLSKAGRPRGRPPSTVPRQFAAPSHGPLLGSETLQPTKQKQRRPAARTAAASKTETILGKRSYK